MEVLWTGLGSIVSRDPQADLPDFCVDVSNLWIGRVSVSDQQTVEWQKYILSGRFIYSAYLCHGIHHRCRSEKISPLPLGLQRTACKYPWIDQPVLYASLVWRRFVF